MIYAKSLETLPSQAFDMTYPKMKKINSFTGLNFTKSQRNEILNRWLRTFTLYAKDPLIIKANEKCLATSPKKNKIDVPSETEL